MADAKATSPLDASVQAILEHPEYILQTQAVALAALLKKHFSHLSIFDAPENVVDGKNVLQNQLNGMGNSIRKLIAKLDGATTTDSMDLKRLFDVQKEYFKLVEKYNSALEANARVMAIEKATIEALQSVGNKDLTDKFMSFLHKNLAEISENE